MIPFRLKQFLRNSQTGRVSRVVNPEGTHMCACVQGAKESRAPGDARDVTLNVAELDSRWGRSCVAQHEEYSIAQ